MINYPRKDGWPSDEWLILSVLVGQADGQVFIPDSALVALDRFQLTVQRDDVRGGYVVRIEPNVVDGEQSDGVGEG